MRYQILNKKVSRFSKGILESSMTVLKCSIINHTNDHIFQRNRTLTIQKTLLIIALSCLTFSLTATLGTYNFYYSPATVDVKFVYRGFPVCWVVESWSFWTMPPTYSLGFVSLNFLIDMFFWTVVFQLPFTFLFLAKATCHNWKSLEKI
jgi:hypothetical protein